MRVSIPILPALVLILLLLSACSDTTSTNGPDGTPAIGTQAPGFTQNDTSGQPVSLSQFRGKVVLIDFWASWCPPCVAEVPNIKALWQKYKDQGLVVLSVSLDKSLDAWKTFIRLNELQWYQVADGRYWDNAVARLYSVYDIPAMYLVGRDGRIVAGTPNGGAVDEQTIANALK
ncbi:MAG TPA: TlpA disulfide reductase family protein [Candidatus Kapabacteria bacterium]|nr:TlpA disulfide reductase family protein [Candidatus Kapabacteria bacterium]